jgi:uncharacterized FlaG/YvyC family protein
MVEDIDQLGSIGAAVTADSASSYDSGSNTAATASSAAQQPGAQALQSALAQVNDRLSSVNRVLELNVDAVSGLTVATIRDSANGEVLQQFPGSDALHLAQMLADWAGGKNALLDLMA